MKRATLHTLGCRLNQSETAIIARELEDLGYRICEWGEVTDLAVINTCTVTAQADAKARNAIRSVIRNNPKAFIAVVGCYSQMGYKTLAEIEGVDLIIGNQEKMNLTRYISEDKKEKPLIIRDTIRRDDFTIDAIGQNALRTRANLKIQDGCDFMCSFCIIPFARGRSRSRDLDNIVDEAKQLALQGFRELVLTGVNIGTFRSEKGDLLRVLKELNCIAGIERVRISSIEPTTIPEEIFEMMNDGGHVLVPYLHIPLQSGSDEILKSMKRLYTATEYRNFIENAAQKVPDLCIGTDVMVGFPGEGEREFQETYDLLLESAVNYFHVFTFSEREGTPALGMPDKVSESDKKNRNAVLRELSERKKRVFYESFKNTARPVLFEEQEAGHWLGYTDNYIRVAVQSEDNLENQIRSVTFRHMSGDVLMGEF